MKWHCYTEHYESIVSSTVDASTVDEAAEMAAREHGTDGLWTVVAIDEKRGVTRVNVTERRSYEATSIESGPS